MKNQKGYSLIVLVMTIIILIILIAIVINPSTQVLDDTERSKELAEAALDNDKIQEIITYELAGTVELIDIEIDLKRVALSDTLSIENEGNTYGDDWVMYLSERDISRVEKKTGNRDYYKPYNEITRSYVVNSKTGEFVRLGEKWKFGS